MNHGYIKLLMISLLLAASAYSLEPLFDAKIDWDVGINPASVFSADFDGDSNYDLAVVNWGSDNVSILKNDGNGSFTSAVKYGTGNGPISLFAADFDTDGNHDLVTANLNSDNISILKNDGNGIFTSIINYSVGVKPVSVFAADLNGDGDYDLAVANILSNDISILFNRSDIILDAEDGENNEPALQLNFLAQNHPNPFNSSTMIEYTVPKQGHVAILIVNLLGQDVKKIVDKEKPAGQYSVVWDGKDSHGQQVATGIYFYRLRIDNLIETKKMLLLK